MDWQNYAKKIRRVGIVRFVMWSFLESCHVFVQTKGLCHIENMEILESLIGV